MENTEWAKAHQSLITLGADPELIENLETLWKRGLDRGDEALMRRTVNLAKALIGELKPAAAAKAEAVKREAERQRAAAKAERQRNLQAKFASEQEANSADQSAANAAALERAVETARSSRAAVNVPVDGLREAVDEYNAPIKPAAGNRSKRPSKKGKSAR